MRAHGTKELWLDALRADAAAFRAVAGEADLTAVVPTCPDWTVLNLVHHLGGVYRWVRSHASRGVTSAPDPATRRHDYPGADETLAWFDEEAKGLIELLDALDPNMPAWNWAPQAKIALFWHRRMAHETAVHRWDIQMSQGMAEPLDDHLAVDGITEVLDSWLPAGKRKGPTDRYGVVQLTAPEEGQEWFVRLRGEGIALLDTDTLLDADGPDTRVHASGPASDLMLALWGRIGFDTLEVSGDESLLASLRTG
ncbi:maleylpyruvate isomerase family mycothiol-dependent enzyme [Catellatospora sp. NPDC049609]|uniref:maleylpyruvate isomerase family mycothiol-dependent enzyme n=1 Tax=Catellatospora sp. NPDC049609 TaxID=3155505 RepID=UPI00342AC0A0